MSDVTGPHSLTGPERAIDSAFIHVTVPDGTVAPPTGLTPTEGPVGSDGAVSGPNPVTISDGVGAVEFAAGGGFGGGDIPSPGISVDLAVGYDPVDYDPLDYDPVGYDSAGSMPDPAVNLPAVPFERHQGTLLPTGPHTLAPTPAAEPPPQAPPSMLEQRTPPGQWDDPRFSGIGRGDLLELAGRLEQLDQLLDRLEEAKRQAADASEHLALTRRWQEETVRTIQEERARMRQRQHALDELADRARAAVEVMQAMYRTLPREVVELAIELQVLDRAGFVTRRPGRPRPDDVT